MNGGCYFLRGFGWLLVFLRGFWMAAWMVRVGVWVLREAGWCNYYQSVCVRRGGGCSIEGIGRSHY